MSLIQEALRRQQKEQQAAQSNAPATAGTEDLPQKDAGTPIATPPPGPTETKTKNVEETQVSDETFILPTSAEPSPEPEEKEEPSEDAPPADETPEPPLRRTASERKHRILAPLAGMLIVIALLAGVVGWSIRWGYRVLTTPDTPPEQETIVESAPVDVDVHVDETTITPTKPDTDADGLDAGFTESAAQVPTETVSPVTPDASADDDSVTTPAVPSPSVIWPELHISGIMGTGDSGSAIINGTVVGLGEKVGDVTVREFERGFVVLEYQGETRRFSVGRSTR